MEEHVVVELDVLVSNIKRKVCNVLDVLKIKIKV
jgi:hypothetical protein